MADTIDLRTSLILVKYAWYCEFRHFWVRVCRFYAVSLPLAATMTSRAVVPFVFLAVTSLVSPSDATDVTRPVHVQAVTSDSVTIIWHTSDPTSSSVEYGPSMQYGSCTTSKRAVREHVVTLHRLEAGREYFYRIRSGDEILYQGSNYRFRTLPDKRSIRFRFLVWGDSGRDNEEQYSLIPAMLDAAPDFMLHVGDVIQTDGAADKFDPCYFVPYQDLLRNTPAWVTLGNHDVMTADGEPLLEAFHLPRNGPFGDERFYSFTYGQAHFVFIDATSPLTSEVLDWLEHDLQSTLTLWTFAVMHYPMYSCGAHGSNHYIRNTLAPIFEAEGVDVVFSGHDHDYQRSHPMRNNEPIDAEQAPHFHNPRGPIYIGTGGGSTVRATSSSCRFTARALSQTHFTLVKVDGTHLRVRAYDITGTVFDDITIDKTFEDVGQLPNPGETGARLLPNLPNPFNPMTLLRYRLDVPSPVGVSVFNATGRRIRHFALGRQEPGLHTLAWDGRDGMGTRMASGVYVVRLQAGATQLTRKVILAE